MSNKFVTISQARGLIIWLVGGTLLADRLFTPTTTATRNYYSTRQIEENNIEKKDKKEKF